MDNAPETQHRNKFLVVLVFLVFVEVTFLWMFTSVFTQTAHAKTHREAGTKIKRGDRQFLSLSPARTTITTSRAQISKPVKLTLFNNSSGDANIRINVVALIADSDGSSFTDISAKKTPEVSWVMPDWKGGVVQSGEKIEFDVKIAPPLDATPGTHVVGISASQTVATAATNTDGKARIAIDGSAVSQLLVNVPGDAVTKFALRAVDTPEFIRSGERATFTIRVRNRGTTLLSGQTYLLLQNPLGSSHRLKTELPPILPRGSREMQIVWSDVPIVGWYTPEVAVSVGNKTETIKLRKVYVMPPWWLIAIAGCAVAGAVTSWIIRRR